MTAPSQRVTSDWECTLGAQVDSRGVFFRVWAPDADKVEVVHERGESTLGNTSDGYFEGLLPELSAGDLYRYRIDGQGPFPDPASRFQPQGVHGPSEVIDGAAFDWTDSEWTGLALDRIILYELHVGTFTPEGTFRSALKKLPYLRDLGITAIELMPVAAFAGSRNWGYDGVALFAPASCYGRPDDLRAFVNEAHGLGMAVHLDVVYNHLGPDGAYLNAFSRYYFTDRHHTPWGSAINFDGECCEPVRSFFIENAVNWVEEFHIDGLRLDATHAIIDDSSTHILEELSESVRQAAASAGRSAVVVAEDSRNLAQMLKPASERGWQLDGVWSDDFHHQMRRGLAGDQDGYFADFSGSAEDIAATIRKGWFYCGQESVYFERPRGSDPGGIDPQRFVFFIQNHDQAGNRAFGDRLHHKIDPASYRAASVLLLMCPQTPLLFMGQEWGASTPFQYFTDHNEELGKLVTEGRRSEFQRFAAFADAEARERIPDPQSLATFERCKLLWDESEQEPQAGMLRMFRAVLALRREQLERNPDPSFNASAAGADCILVERGGLLVVARLRGSGPVEVPDDSRSMSNASADWKKVLSTEGSEFTADAMPIEMEHAQRGLRLNFRRPGAVILRP